jgi:uncharacterized protein
VSILFSNMENVMEILKWPRMNFRISCMIKRNKRYMLFETTGIILIAALAASNTVLYLSTSSLSSKIFAFGSDGGLTSESLAGVLYVHNKESENISVMNLATGAIVRNITLDVGSVQNMKLSEDQLTLYLITDTPSGSIYALNTTSNELTNHISAGFRTEHIATFNNTLYISDALGGRVIVLNSSGNVIDEIDIGPGPQYLEIRPDGHVLYVSRVGGSISVVDLEQHLSIKEIDSVVDSGRANRHLSFTNDGSMIFNLDSESNTLLVIDGYEHEIIKIIPVGNNPQYMALSSDERLAYVTNLDSDTLSLVDIQELEVVDEISVGNGPSGIALSPDGGDFVYVSSTRGDYVSVINSASGSIVGTFYAGGVGPDQIIVRKPLIDIIRTADIEHDNASSSSIVAQVFVEIADDPEESARGLMFREYLPWNSGMLFPFHDEQPRTFWMKNTFIPLDMIFIDRSSKIVDIRENVPPCTQDECPTYPSMEPAQFVLEVNAGFVQENGIMIGDQLGLPRSN